MKLPEPVAWMHRSNHMHFIKESPLGEIGFLFNPLYTAAQMREYRNAALEEAALVCDEEAMDESDDFAMRRMESCARTIRNLKEVQS